MLTCKSFKYLVLVGTLILFFNFSAQAQPSFSLTDTSGTVGDSISIPIYVSEINEENGFYSFQFNIAYDSDILFLDTIETNGTLFEGAYIVANPNYAEGKMRIAGASFNKITSPGILLYIKADSLKIGQSDLSWDDVLFEGEDGVPLNVNYTNGRVTVEQLSVPNLSSPDNGETGVIISPVIKWYKVEGASSYNLQLSSDDTFTDLIVNQTNIIDTSYNVVDLNYETTYYWRVKAKNAYDTSDWSEIWNFTTIGVVPEKVNLAYPPDDTTFVVQEGEQTSIKLQWFTTLNETLAYEFEIATDENFSQIVDSSSELSDTFYVFNNAEIQKIYYWRVRAGNEYGWGEFSDVWSFNLILTDVQDEQLIKSFILQQNYPNPFNPSTIIKFGLPVQSNVVLKIFNVLGQEVQTLYNGTLEAGYHNFDFNAKNLTTGMYIYTINAEGSNGEKFSEVKKMLLVK